MQLLGSCMMSESWLLGMHSSYQSNCWDMKLVRGQLNTWCCYRFEVYNSEWWIILTKDSQVERVKMNYQYHSREQKPCSLWETQLSLWEKYFACCWMLIATERSNWGKRDRLSQMKLVEKTQFLDQEAKLMRQPLS